MTHTIKKSDEDHRDELPEVPSASHWNWLDALSKYKDANKGLTVPSEFWDKSESHSYGFRENELLSSFLGTLSGVPDRPRTLDKDIEVIRKIANLVIEALEQRILDDREAKVLIDFFTSKFVERRFNALLTHSFDLGSEEKRSLHFIKGLRK